MDYQGNFIITKYFYPIKKGGTEKFFDGIYFDNPRTDEELRIVAEILKKGYEKINNSIDELKYFIEHFIECYQNDELVKEYSQNSSKTDDLFYALAKMWVIVRCNNILDKEEIKHTCPLNLETMEFEYSEENINQVNFNPINKYLQFLNFMSSDLYDFNFPILISDDTDFYGFFFSEFRDWSQYFQYIIYGVPNNPYKINKSFKLLSEDFYHNISLIENKFKDKKFLYIRDSIANFANLITSNQKMYLIGIVSIIEMLLTHNPDRSLYNIEDSISKQYVRKLKYLLYKNNESIDLEKLEKELKLSYKIRSDIAHGNFGKESDENLKALHKFYNTFEDKRHYLPNIEDGLDILNENLTKYAKIVLNMYLTNEKELELLKDL